MTTALTAPGCPWGDVAGWLASELARLGIAGSSAVKEAS